MSVGFTKQPLTVSLRLRAKYKRPQLFSGYLLLAYWNKKRSCRKETVRLLRWSLCTWPY